MFSFKALLSGKPLLSVDRGAFMQLSQTFKGWPNGCGKGWETTDLWVESGLICEKSRLIEKHVWLTDYSHSVSSYVCLLRWGKSACFKLLLTEWKDNLQTQIRALFSAHYSIHVNTNHCMSAERSNPLFAINKQSPAIIVSLESAKFCSCRSAR